MGQAERLHSLFLKWAAGVAHRIFRTIPHPLTLTVIQRVLKQIFMDRLFVAEIRIKVMKAQLRNIIYTIQYI